MKKTKSRIKLSIQVTLVFIAAFIFTHVFVAFAVTQSTESIYEDIVYQKLEAEGKAIAQYSGSSEFQHEADMAIIQYSSDRQAYLTSENIGQYADAEAVALLIGKAAEQTQNAARYVNIIGDKKIYYVIIKYHGFFEVQSHDTFIVLTDDTMKSTMMETMRNKVMSIFLLSFLFGYLIVLIWIFRLVRDTKNISFSLKSIESNFYRTKLETHRRDEIGDLVESIEQMREKITENDKQKQEIIQGVSHDLKTPIAVIRSYSEAMKDGLCDPSEVAEVTETECIRLDRKVTELLNVTRLNYIDLNRETLGDIRMDVLIEDMLKRYRHMTKAQFVLDLKPVSFFGEHESWRVVLQSLLDNAIRYADTTIYITLRKDYLSVCNDGRNIDEERLPNIFKAFEKSSDGNFGIGLSIVRRTADLFGYTASARNSENGVCFEISK